MCVIKEVHTTVILFRLLSVTDRIYLKIFFVLSSCSFMQITIALEALPLQSSSLPGVAVGGNAKLTPGCPGRGGLLPVKSE